MGRIDGHTAGGRDRALRSGLAVAILPMMPGLTWLSCAGRAAEPPEPAYGVIETPTGLAATIEGKDDALVVRRPDEDKLPVALVAHGASPGNPRAANLGWLRGWAHDLARRGYGKSDGQVADDAGNCTRLRCLAARGRIPSRGCAGPRAGLLPGAGQSRVLAGGRELQPHRPISPASSGSTLTPACRDLTNTVSHDVSMSHRSPAG